MTRKPQIAVTLILETDDPRLQPENLTNLKTPADMEALRSVVVSALPSMTRVVQVTSEETMRMVMLLGRAAVQNIGLDVVQPPPGYVAPADRR